MRKCAKVTAAYGRAGHGRVTFACALSLLSGLRCSDQESSSPKDAGGKITQALAADFEGVYTLTARTLNPSACSPGPSTLANTTDTSFVLVAASLFGEQTLELVSCKADTCADTAEKTKNQTIVGSEFRYSFSGTKGSDVLTGFIAWSGGDNGSGMCTERSFDEFTLTRMGDGLHLERTTKALPDAPAEEGFCFADPELEKKEAAGAPCSEMETLDAMFSGALP